MTAAKELENIISKIPEGEVFGFDELGLPNEYWDRSRMKLSRMVAKGLLSKASNGKYYKPRTSILGILPPSQNELVKDLLYKKGEIVGYLTYLSIWNDMKLTSQISSTIFIGSSIKRNPMKRKLQRIKFLFQPNVITEGNKHLLQILDTIKFIQKIPDTDIDNSVRRIIDIIHNRPDFELEEMAKLSFKYPPRTRAVLGAIFSHIGNNNLAVMLKEKLNPATIYKLGISETVLPTINDWKIL